MIFLAEQVLLTTISAAMVYFHALLGGGMLFFWLAGYLAVAAALGWLGHILYAPLPTPIGRATGREGKARATYPMSDMRLRVELLMVQAFLIGLGVIWRADSGPVDPLRRCRLASAHPENHQPAVGVCVQWKSS